VSIRNRDGRPRQESRVIGVRFPVDHPFWAYSEGSRASRVRELVDMALLGQVKLVVEDMAGIKDAIDHIRKAVARIEERLDTLEAVSPKKPKPPPPVKIDPAAFLDI